MNPNIVIVLAAFNGACFLADQLDSLIAQTESRWNLLIRDDGSTDDTLEIIQDYLEKDERIRLITDDWGGDNSASGNFSILLETALAFGADYVFCCDQDDVWAPDKLECVMARLQQLDKGDGTPSLVHHDLEVVDRSLAPVADSFVQLMRIQPGSQRNPQRLVSRNEITGCAMACNRALLEIALPIPEKAMMHDWWLGLHAGFFGRLSFMPQKLVKYRQHKSNAIGAKSFWYGLNPLTNWVRGWHRGDREFLDTVQQATAFRLVISDQPGGHTEEFRRLNLYIRLPTMTRLQRLKVLKKVGMWRRHWILNVVLVLRMLLLPREVKF